MYSARTKNQQLCWLPQQHRKGHEDDQFSLIKYELLIRLTPWNFQTVLYPMPHSSDFLGSWKINQSIDMKPLRIIKAISLITIKCSKIWNFIFIFLLKKIFGRLTLNTNLCIIYLIELETRYIIDEFHFYLRDSTQNDI